LKQQEAIDQSINQSAGTAGTGLVDHATAYNIQMSVNTVNLEDHQPQTPLGLILAPIISQQNPLQSHYTILIGWTRPYNKLGIVQKSGQIRIGDRLVEINNVSVRSWTYEKIIRVLRCFDDGVRIKSLGFEVLKDDLAFNSGIQNRTFNWSVARRRLYSLTSSIQSYRIDVEEDDADAAVDSDNRRKQKVVKFEIRCQLLIRHYQKNDQTINFSIWKRYSELKAMHEVLKKGFEWQLDGANQGRGVSIPSNRYIQSIFYGAASDKFLEKRRRELDDYWSLLQTCPDVFDFADPASHRFSKDMADFLSIEKYLHSPDLIQADSTTCDHKSAGSGLRNQQKGQGEEGHIIPSTSGLDLDMSALSDILPTSKSGGELELDESLGRFGEIVVPGGLSATPARTPTRTSRTGNNSKRRRRTAAAKPAFQRRLLDDL
jgi:hypothetical protein